MKITLKNIEYSERLSEETSAFSATVYIDGVPAFGVSNHGTGGCDEHYPLKGQSYEKMRKKLAELEAYAKTLPSEVYQGITIERSAESLIGNALTEFLLVRDVKKELAKRTVAKIAGRPRLASFKVKYSPAVAALLRGPKYNAEVILNELPIEKAIEMFKADDELAAAKTV